MVSLAEAILRFRLARYMVASATGTAIDLGSFLVLYRYGTPAIGAAVAGYVLGMIAHWFVSSRYVFADRLAGPGLARGRQQALFAASAVFGLLLTAGIVGVVESRGGDPRIGKLLAMGVSFASVFLLRLTLVFRAH